MSKVSELISQIKSEKVGLTGKRVLLVEGTDDVQAYWIFLSKKFPQWEQSWAIAEIGNKKRLIDAIHLENNWLGLLDKDEWSDTVQAQYQHSHPNLQVLPRFCLESYLVSPVELWAALPPKQKGKIDGGEEAFRNVLTASKDEWIRHAALWHGVRPLWQQLKQEGFPDKASRLPPSPNDSELMEFFTAWSRLLGDPQMLLTRVHNLENEMKKMHEEEFYKSWLHAKHFYKQVVHPLLDRLLGQKPENERRLAIFRTRQVADDLDVVWKAMGLID